MVCGNCLDLGLCCFVLELGLVLRVWYVVWMVWLCVFRCVVIVVLLHANRLVC